MERRLMQESYCNFAQYIDEQFICWYTGKQCTNNDIPNKYTCMEYQRHNKKIRKGDRQIWQA